MLEYIIGDYKMTRDKNILLFLMLLIPLSVFALINVGYNQGRNYTNEYIIKFENYKRYIVNDTNIPFKYFEKSLTVDTSFKVGGFLNIEEFNISKNNTGDTYLFNGLKYWTMTNEGSEYYAISSNNSQKYSLYPQDSEIGVRVTEYVKEKTKVYGKGSFTNPWVFIKKYQVDLLSSNESLGSATPTSQVVSLSETAEFTISIANGYDFSVENCLAIIDNNKVYIDNVGNDMTCNLEFTPKTYTLTFNNNGGSGCATKSITYGNAYGTLCTPSRSNYTFLGWYTASSGGSLVTSSTVAAGNATIYAQWTPMNYTLTYNNNGGSGCANKSVTYGSTYGTLCTPTRSNYTFNGWFTASSGGSSVTSSTVTSGNATIYAQWTPINYTLTYNNNGGSGCTSKTVTYGSAYGALCTPSRSNHTFLGWYTASSGGSSVTSSTVTSGDATIYAQWLVNTCTITYAPGISATIANFPSSQTVNAGSYITISSLVPSTTSYGFNGWSYGGSTYAPNSSLGVCNGANYTLTATWVTNAVARYPDVKVTVGGTTSNDYAYTSGSWGFKSVTSLNYQNQNSSHNVCEIDLNTSSSITLPSSGEVFKVKAYIYGATTYQIQWCTCTDPVSCCKSGDIASFSGGDGSYMENGTSYTKTNGYWGISGVSLGHQVSYSKSVSKYFRMRGVKGSTYSDWTAIYNSNWSRSSSTGNFSSYCN
jgi:uncharacterized repeat protein (TIGR02543 family)